MLSFVDCEFPDDEEAQVVNTPGVEKEGQGDTVGMGCECFVLFVIIADRSSLAYEIHIC